MRFKHVPLILFSGGLWLAIGLFLLSKGLKLVVAAAHESEPSFLIQTLSPVVGGGEQAALFLICVGLLLGFIKGRFVLAKSVQRVCLRILSFTPPVAIGDVYSKGYYLLILLMMSFGMILRWLPIGLDIKGVIDIVIGSALMNGSLLYFRSARAV